MAFWDKVSSKGNVEDRRGLGPVISGVSIGGVALFMMVNVLLGGEIDLNQVLGLIQQVEVATSQQQIDRSQFEGEDSYERFASAVLGSNNELWQTKFEQLNQTYLEPVLVLFRTATQSSCGTATSQVGPHYCPIDNTIYLDETFFDELTTRLGAQGGDVAEAYVIAHEVGHHVQNLLGVLRPGQTNEESIQIELQADCFAGLWAHSVKELGVFQPGEIGEAMDAAAAVGDDRIQEKVTGYVNPESWTHGSSEERVRWFTRGYETGEFAACDTYN